LVVTFILSLSINFIALTAQIRHSWPAERHHTYLGHDHPRELPIKLRTVNMEFHDDIDHYPIDGVESAAQWNAIKPPDFGYVFLGGSYYPYGVSMWHEIHCLGHIRALIVNGDDGSEHTQHCFQYLRNAILCGADLTLEEVGTDKLLANGAMTAQGEATVHTCRDWKQVRDWQEEQYVKWTPDMHRRLTE
ncbi:hypothetical protein BC834DRAFT_791679, partial [Gloeopeniophorella convolvens]